MALDSGIEDLNKQLDDSINKLRDEHTNLKERHQDHLERKNVTARKNGGENCKPSDIIRLSVRGTEMFARRDTLTIVTGSRLEALFSGRWENQLLRDSTGRVFIDVNFDVFKKILEYLYMVKISDDVPPLPVIEESKKEMFEFYINFFKLRANLDLPAKVIVRRLSLQGDGNQLSADDRKALIGGMKRKLDDMEEKLTQEDSFVACFKMAKGGGNANNTKEEDGKGQDTDVVDVDIGQEILDLYLNGEIVSYKRATLCVDETSNLAKYLGNQEWLREHTIRTKDKKKCILIEQPSDVFKALADFLNMSGFSKDIDYVPLPTFGNEVVEGNYFSRMVKHYFQDESPIFMAFKSINIMFETSSIITSTSDRVKIKEWLASAGKTSKPRLLYRASRDGWDASDFHCLCDGKGATVTVVKSSDGYIFGGYTDAAWGGTSAGTYKPSTVSFLFSLKDHAGIGPVKMPIMKEMTSNAVYITSSYGPSFGSGHDFIVATNSNIDDSSYCYVGETYALPRNSDDPHFLTGSDSFTISEYEVFLV